MFRYLIGLMLVLPAISGTVQGKGLDEAAVSGFIADMVEKDGFDKKELDVVFTQAKRSDRIIKAMSRPAEKAKPWYEYRKHFLTKARINGGIEFWRRNADTLDEAARVYGVPAEIIVAIIGVETAYGKVTGRDRVIDALSTLAFHYPKKNEKRMRFFREQLRQMFLMSREQQLDPLSLTGSYAGAMGIPQFMPESYRKYAVDFDDDGRSDIWKDRADAIGSVANYLKAHGWDRGKSIVVSASGDASTAETLLTDSVKPHLSLDEFSRRGIEPMSATANTDELAALFELEAKDSKEYWLALNNFYVIMRYNPRTKYAMAVVTLAEAIRDARPESMS
jgi:membrane-bound lytic murein transglycosylase B